MSLTSRIFELGYQVTALPATMPTKDYPARCEVTNALDGLFGFVIGNLKGLASPVAQIVLVALAVGLIVTGARNSNKLVRGIVFVIGGLLLLTVATQLVASFSAGTC